jgi:Bacterial Ig domain
MNAKVGSTDKVQIMYAAWSQPIGGRGVGVPNIDLALLTKAGVASGNQKPVATPFYGLTAYGAAFTGALATVVVDPEAAALTYKALPLYGPANGAVAISVTGAFIYTPGPSFTGYDRFFYSVDDNVTGPVVGEVIIGVSPDSPLPALPLPTAAMVTPAVIVRNKFVQVNAAWQSISFPLEVSPQAVAGDVYRMTIRTPAYDCDGAVFYHVSCYDILIGACK